MQLVRGKCCGCGVNVTDSTGFVLHQLCKNTRINVLFIIDY